MNDINAIAGQINSNTKIQGKELLRTDENMTDVVTNTEDAHKEILEARGYQKSTSKWMCWLLLAIAVILAIILLAVFVHK